jgi:hypothetical protein
MTHRLLREKNKSIEHKALLAVVMGDDAESKRLGNLLERRNRLGLRVVAKVHPDNS